MSQVHENDGMNEKWRHILQQSEQRIHDLEAILQEKDKIIDSLLAQWTTTTKDHDNSVVDTLYERPLSTLPHVSVVSNSDDIHEPSNTNRFTPWSYQSSFSPTHPPMILSSQQIERYSRQLMISNGFGIHGQEKLQASSILVIGAGGIGSTVLLYLAACGVGHITIVDHDTVELSNLHRQIIHSQQRLGMNKAVSAVITLQQLNSTLSIKAITERLTRHNALSIIQSHTLVIDASDNADTRYCVNDTCVLAGNIPLISGSAMGLEGQVSVYVNRQCVSLSSSSSIPQEQGDTVNHMGDDENHHHHPLQPHQQSTNIPCYRCMYPTMPQSEACKSCNDHGVLGPIPGLIGILVSIEAIKIITGIGKPLVDRLLMYDSMQPSFYFFKKPTTTTTHRRNDCIVCYPSTKNNNNNNNASSLEVYNQHLGESTRTHPTTLEENHTLSYHEITWEEYRDTIHNHHHPHVLLDVRVRRQYEMCSLPGSVNIPLQELKMNTSRILTLSEYGHVPIYCICRRGIASLEATRYLSSIVFENHADTITTTTTSLTQLQVYNIQGGLNYWSKHIDPTFPTY